MGVSYKEQIKNKSLDSWAVVNEQKQLNKSDRIDWNKILGVSLSKFCYASKARGRTAADTLELITETCPYLIEDEKKKLYIGVNARFAEMQTMGKINGEMEEFNMENDKDKPVEREFKEVETNMWNAEKEGDFLQGVYLSNESQVGENKSMVYHIQDDTGEVIGVWGSTVLDNKMKMVSFNQYIKITYLGQKPSPNRKDKNYKDFKLEKDKSQS